MDEVLRQILELIHRLRLLRKQNELSLSGPIKVAQIRGQRKEVATNELALLLQKNLLCPSTLTELYACPRILSVSFKRRLGLRVIGKLGSR